MYWNLSFFVENSKDYFFYSTQQTASKTLSWKICPLQRKEKNLSNDLNEVRTITDINDTFDHENNFDGANKSII